MTLTTQQAAQVTGKSRSTIWRALKSGKVFAERTATADFVIEVAEGERGFGPLDPPDMSYQGSMKLHETVSESSAVRWAMDLLCEQIGLSAAGPGWQHRTAAGAAAAAEERAKRQTALAGTGRDRARLVGGTAAPTKARPTTPAPWPASGSGDARR